MYHFTREQMYKLLDETIGMFIEYRDVHGHNEESARLSAVLEELEGLDAEQELYYQGECPNPGQAMLTLSDCPHCGFPFAAHGPRGQCPKDASTASAILQGEDRHYD